MGNKLRSQIEGEETCSLSIVIEPELFEDEEQVEASEGEEGEETCSLSIVIEPELFEDGEQARTSKGEEGKETCSLSTINGYDINRKGTSQIYTSLFPKCKFNE